jgi:hypothetical protein
VVYVKITKFVHKEAFSLRVFCVFAEVHGTFHAHIEYGDIHAYIFPKIINILKFIFRIKEAYGHGSKVHFRLLMHYTTQTLCPRKDPKTYLFFNHNDYDRGHCGSVSEDTFPCASSLLHFFAM